MLDLTETTEEPDFEQFYTHTDGTHWVHSSLYISEPTINCWFTPDALVMWHPEVFTYDLKTPVSPLLGFPTFAPKNLEGTLADYVGGAWVAYRGEDLTLAERKSLVGYVYVNALGSTIVRIESFKRIVANRLEVVRRYSSWLG